MTNDPMTDGNEADRLRFGHWDIGHRAWPPIFSQLLLKLTHDPGFGEALSNEAQVGDFHNKFEEMDHLMAFLV